MHPPARSTPSRRFTAPLTALYLFLAATCLQAAEVSRTPPEVYATRVAPLLTPVETITAPRERKPDDTASGATLLDERIHIVDTEGRRIMVWHLAWKAFTDAGAKTIAEDVTSYLRKDQKYHLVTAETIQPDGTVLPVRPNAVLVQSPQRQADYALYDDEEEVKVIFPNVKAGSITRIIAVIEDVNVRMPGEYAQSFAWSRNWELDRLHFVVDMPVSLGERVNIHTTGSGIPEMERSEPEPGRVRFRWRAERLASRRYEPGRAPSTQVGPCVRVSTIASWDDVSRWFSGLTKTRDQLSPGLAAQVDAWTAGLTSREDIVRVLLAKVANDVRYTGLELGQAAYQPHDCNEVWENQYGDCKDKANLLAAFLRHKGIDTRIVLVNTEHLGLLDRRSPSYGVFNHAIAAIADGKGGYEFCDPTISFCEPGMIGPGSADRDVLVIEEAGGRWMRTPVQRAGGFAYDFDLDLSATGELSGWMTVTADGYYGAGQRERFRRRDADETKRQMADWVRGFFPGADVVDAVKTNEGASTGPEIMKAYFIAPAQRDQMDGRTTLRFPHGRWLLPDMGTSAQRESAYFLYQDRIALRATIRLPQGLQVETRPEPYRFETPVGHAQARWEVGEGVVHAEIESSITQSAVGAQDFGGYYQAVQSMLAWLGQPVVLKTATAAMAGATTSGGSTIELPLMPTGAGQLELVDRRYPYEGSHTLRRAALERTLQYFPHDRKTVFHAHVRIGFLEWAADQNEAALNRVLPLLASYRADVSIHDYAWAENLQALALRDLGRRDEALEIFTRVAGDPAMSNFRRSNTLLSAADMLMAENKTGEAVALLAGGLDLDPDKRTLTYQRFIRLLMEAGDTSRAQEALASLAASHPDVADGVFVYLIRDALGWAGAGALERMHALGASIARVWPQPGTELAGLLAEVESRKSSLGIAAAVQADLEARLARAPLDAWYRPVRDPALKTWADFNRAIEAAESAGDAERGTLLGVEALVTLPVDGEFGARLERAAGQAEWWARKVAKEPPPAIFPVLLDLGERMPVTDDANLESRFWRARWLARRGDAAGERAIFQAILKIEGIKPAFRVAANARLGRNFENAGRYAAAVSAYQRLEVDAPRFGLGVESLLRAAFINLHLKRQDEALRIIRLLAQVPDDVLKKTSGETWIREFITLEKSGGAKAFWDAREGWWRRWNTVKSGQKFAKDSVDEVVPVIDDLDALKTRIGQAVANKNLTAFMEDFLPLVSGARWLPSLSVEVGALSDDLASLAPDKRTPVYDMVIAMLEIPVPDPVIDRRRRPLQLAAHLLDTQKPQRALEVLATCRPTELAKDRIDLTLLRLWALASIATRREREECVAALEKSLADPAMPILRTESVESLASLYRALGQGAKEKALLLRESGNALSADAEGKKRLASRLAALGGSLRIAEQVDSWISRAGLDWYAFAEPGSLADPGIGDLDTLLAAPEGRLSPTEIVKLRLLVAQDAGRAVEAQQEAWCVALSDVVNWTGAHADVRKVLDPILSGEDIPVQVRLHALWLGLLRMAESRNVVEFSRWHHHPLTRRLEPWRRDALPLLETFSRIPPGDARKEHALLKEIVAADIGPAEAHVMNKLTEALLMQGRTEELEALTADISGWRTLPHMNLTRERLQLEILRRVEQTRRHQPLYQGLVKTVMREFPDKPRNVPRETKERDRPRWVEYARIPSESDWQVFHWLVGQGWIFDNRLGLWAQAARLHPEKPKYREIGLHLLEAGLQHAVDDRQRAETIRTFALSVDIDQRTVRERLMVLLEPWRDPLVHPATSAEIAFLEIFIRLRTGEPMDFETALAQIKAPGIGLLRVALLQRHLVQTKDGAGLRRLLDAQPEAWLLDEKLIHQTLRMYELLGREREAGLVRTELRRELRRQVVRSWSGEEPPVWELACVLGLALDDPEAIPDGWYVAMGEKVRGHDRLLIDLVRARLAKNWDAVIARADDGIRVAPAFYHWYWQKGYAAAKAGRVAEAREALTIFVQHAKDELEYPEAVALLEQLGR